MRLLQSFFVYVLLNLIGVASILAQDLAVQSFQLDETDLTANTPGTLVYDQNGEKCALIKVETTQKGFFFDGGMLGVMKVDENHICETWVYVPDRLSHLTIAHPQLGMLRNYDLGMSVQKGRTYILKLATGRIVESQPQEEVPQHPKQDPQLRQQVITVRGVSFTMIQVQGGTFNMGGTYEQFERNRNELPVHQVTLSDYFIAETEVTQALWKAVMGTNPSRHKGDNLPVERVSWKDCQKFIQQLNALTGKTFRLPTEAEWEYAARGGNQSKGYLYAGSDSLQVVAWYSCKTSHEVKTKRPNELGIYDMSGNVWEWCQDKYGRYQEYAVTNPQGAKSGHYVSRGGSWDFIARACRVAYRTDEKSDVRESDMGFRLAL